MKGLVCSSFSCSLSLAPLLTDERECVCEREMDVYNWKKQPNKCEQKDAQEAR
jgi:hypothetical protein